MVIHHTACSTNLFAGAHNQQYVYESSPGFQALPSFGIIAAFGATDAVPLHRILPNFDHVCATAYRSVSDNTLLLARSSSSVVLFATR